MATVFAARVLGFASQPATAATRPNILHVIADDVGADSLSLWNTNPRIIGTDFYRNTRLQLFCV